MKKIFYILASAIVALGAVACENEGLENINPENNGNGEGLTITATIDEATKVVFTDFAATGWESGDYVTIGGHTFNYVPAEGLFRCENEAAKALIGTEQLATANALNSANGIKGSSFVATEAVEIQPGVNISFKLSSALLKYTTTEEVAFTGTALSGAFTDATKAGSVKYIAVNTGEEVTLSYSVDGVQCKSLTKNFEPGKIYDLGELVAPVGLCYKGSWDNWTNLRGMFSEGDYYVAKNVECPANTTFKFVIKSSGVMMGATSATTSLGTWNAFANNDIKIATAGTYNIYVSKNSGAWCVVKSTTSVPALNNKKYLYLMPNSGWKSDSAKFGAWCYGGSAADANKNFTWAMYENSNDYYYLDVTGHKQFYIKRLSSDGNSTWNEVGPITIGNNTLVTITGWNATSYTATSLIP